MVIYQGTQWKITLYKQLQVKVIYFGQNDWPLQVMAYLNTSDVKKTSTSMNLDRHTADGRNPALVDMVSISLRSQTPPEKS